MKEQTSREDYDELTVKERAAAVVEFCKGFGVTVVATYNGFFIEPGKSNPKIAPWPHYQFTYAILKDGATITNGPFKCGSAHGIAVESVTDPDGSLAQRWIKKANADGSEVRKHNAHYVKYPTQLDILYSLSSDAQYAQGETFASFCCSLGYDDDSIKARDTYMACQATADTLRGIFGREGAEKLADIVSGY